MCEKKYRKYTNLQYQIVEDDVKSYNLDETVDLLNELDYLVDCHEEFIHHQDETIKDLIRDRSDWKRIVDNLLKEVDIANEHIIQLKQEKKELEDELAGKLECIAQQYHDKNNLVGAMITEEIKELLRLER